VIDLPRDLAPWRPLLDLFAPELAEGLGRLVPRLSLTVGPLRIHRPTGDGDPDGFTGLGRRGSYERLLLSEWLLADELPDEFLRRAASGEHAFYQLARRSPARASSSVALFDAGPDQLGAPRVAHLAALIVLAARAERAGARFAWGLLHQPDAHLLTEVTRQSVGQLLTGRTALPPTGEEIAAWAERARASGWEDAWIVGGASTWPGWRHAALEVADVIEPDRRAVLVTACAPGASPRAVELEMPPEAASTRLLRDPFSVAAPPPQGSGSSPSKTAAPPVSNLVFGGNGVKLFARAGSGEILAYPVPNSPNAGAARVKRYRARAGGVVAAVGWVHRGLVMLVIADGRLFLEHTLRSGPPFLDRVVPIPAGLEITPAPLDGPLSPLIYSDVGPVEVSFLDARGALFSALSHEEEHRGTGPTDVKCFALEVSALLPAGARFVYVGRGHGYDVDPSQPAAPGADRWSIVLHGGGDPRVARIEREGDGTFEAHAGFDGNHADPFGAALFAIQDKGDRWSLTGTSVSDEQVVPAGERVVGPFRLDGRSPVGLLVLTADQRTLAVRGAEGERALHRAAAPIRDAVISPVRAQVAYVTTAGEVVIVALDGGSVLVRYGG
jgi:hypothetical protein